MTSTTTTALKSLKLSGLFVALAATLSACGGGDGGGSGSSAFSPKNISGAAVDFYLANAKVAFSNTACQTLNPNTTTDAEGKFSFKTSKECQETEITLTEGIDTVTKVPFAGQLKIKSTNYQKKSSPAIVASPLTTLQAELPTADFTALLKNLGFSLSKDVTDFDPVKDGTNAELAAVFVLQQMLTQLEQAGLTLSEAVTAIKTTAATNRLIAADGSINTSLITATFDEAVKLRPLSATALNASKEKLVKTAELITNAIINAGDKGLSEYLEQNQNLIAEIQENTAVATYSKVRILDFDIDEVKDQTNRKVLSKAALNASLVNVQFSLPVNVNGTDTFKLGFKTKAAIGSSRTETLDLYISAAEVSFTNGAISQVALPAGANIYVSSSLADLPTASFTTPTYKVISSSTSISLQDLINAYPVTLSGPYNKYLALVQSTGSDIDLDIDAYALPAKYPISAALGLRFGSFSMTGPSSTAITFDGVTATAYLKLK